MSSGQQDLVGAIVPPVTEGVQRGADVLNAMLQASVELATPHIAVVAAAELSERLSRSYHGPIAWVRMGYLGDLEGAVELVFSRDEASRLASVISADLSPADDPDAIRRAVVSEVGNVVINSVVGTLSNAFSLELRFTVPEYSEGLVENIVARVEDLQKAQVILVETEFHVARFDIRGLMILYFSVVTLDQLGLRRDE